MYSHNKAVILVPYLKVTDNFSDISFSVEGRCDPFILYAIAKQQLLRNGYKLCLV
jgi:hypothetical protein